MTAKYCSICGLHASFQINYHLINSLNPLYYQNQLKDWLLSSPAQQQVNNSIKQLSKQQGIKPAV
jgi:hypothetical protein